jgi:hypothetical protein
MEWRAADGVVHTNLKKDEGSKTMSKKFATFLFAAMVLFAWPAANLVAQTNSSTKAAVAAKTTGHPEKATTAVAVHQTAKPKPAAKLEKIPKAPHANTSWVSGDYYWDGNNWQWDGGYWLDNPWQEATWMPGHWNERWWGWTWVPGYWY